MRHDMNEVSGARSWQETVGPTVRPVYLYVDPQDQQTGWLRGLWAGMWGFMRK